MIEIDSQIAESKLNSDLNILNDPRIAVKTIGHGNHGNGSRGSGENLKLSLEMKGLIGAIAKANGHGGAKLVAEAFGLNRSVVSRYQNGKLGRTDGPVIKEDLKKIVDDKLDKVREQAIDRLLEVMGVITPESMAKLGANSAADLGLKMASIHEKLAPKGAIAPTNIAQVVIMAPRVREEKEYMTIEVEAVRD